MTKKQGYDGKRYWGNSDCGNYVSLVWQGVVVQDRLLHLDKRFSEDLPSQ